MDAVGRATSKGKADAAAYELMAFRRPRSPLYLDAGIAYHRDKFENSFAPIRQDDFKTCRPRGPLLYVYPMVAFPSPVGGASLILSFRPYQKTIIVIGSSSLAASRAFSALEADATVVIIARGGVQEACEELRWRAEQAQLTLLDFNELPGPVAAEQDREAGVLDAYLSTMDNLSLLCVTDTSYGPNTVQRRNFESAANIARICRARRVPVNVADHPELCDFTFTSTHRFTDSRDGSVTPLQIGVTTNGQGCRLGGRIRRDVVSRLPKEIGIAVMNIGKLRDLAKEVGESDPRTVVSIEAESTPNTPVSQRQSSDAESPLEKARRRMRWVAQVSEYWPYSRLASMSESERSDVLGGDAGIGITGLHINGAVHHAGDSEVNSLHALQLSPPAPQGRIFLVGSGPGHPSLLTVATHDALTRHANLVLSDKLVPPAVLALIPSGVEVRIARKFPGNADGAQNELMEAAIEAASRGLTVVRVCMSLVLSRHEVS